MGAVYMRVESILEKMKNRTPSILGQEKSRRFAILLPLIQTENGIEVLFEVRAYHMRSQPGDVCFPGGKIDSSDENARASAIRETTEELGIEAENIQNVLPLDYIVSDYGSTIFPFVGELTNIDDMQLNEAEVAEVFTVPLTYFLETEPDIYYVRFEAVPEKDFPFELIQGGKNYDWRPRELKEYFYEYEGKVIWGLTARMIHHFAKSLLKEDIVTNHS